MELFYKKKYNKYKFKYINIKNNIKGGVNSNIKAIAFFSNSDIKGTVRFEEIFHLDNKNEILVDINLEGFIPNTLHGFHIHETGDLSNGCDSMCAHFNPKNKSHGGRDDEERHIGDLGNLQADNEGKVKLCFYDKLIKLRGDDSNIIGRGVVIHADPDDCGKGEHTDSKTTGHSGKRIACAIIGYASNKINDFSNNHI